MDATANLGELQTYKEQELPSLEPLDQVLGERALVLDSAVDTDSIPRNTIEEPIGKAMDYSEEISELPDLPDKLGVPLEVQAVEVAMSCQEVQAVEVAMSCQEVQAVEVAMSCQAISQLSSLSPEGDAQSEETPTSSQVLHSAMESIEGTPRSKFDYKEKLMHLSARKPTKKKKGTGRYGMFTPDPDESSTEALLANMPFQNMRKRPKSSNSIKKQSMRVCGSSRGRRRQSRGRRGGNHGGVGRGKMRSKKRALDNQDNIVYENCDQFPLNLEREIHNPSAEAAPYKSQDEIATELPKKYDIIINGSSDPLKEDNESEEILSPSHHLNQEKTLLEGKTQKVCIEQPHVLASQSPLNKKQAHLQKKILPNGKSEKGQKGYPQTAQTVLPAKPHAYNSLRPQLNEKQTQLQMSGCMMKVPERKAARGCYSKITATNQLKRPLMEQVRQADDEITVLDHIIHRPSPPYNSRSDFVIPVFNFQGHKIRNSLLSKEIIDGISSKTTFCNQDLFSCHIKGSYVKYRKPKHINIQVSNVIA
ncbi:unnamed protein product [Darwinula stevensoni]|uniref:Uncharacterized protein n=1 Tax=Darwinula stevensoni TaxID=69355 RepID=A0A7R8X415_9CRUS|nr:unnamed protein product [Darwinula stevensoni]CAG0882980.1 unnamed protein product [Darwinula stevensoni]